MDRIVWHRKDTNNNGRHFISVFPVNYRTGKQPTISYNVLKHGSKLYPISDVHITSYSTKKSTCRRSVIDVEFTSASSICYYETWGGNILTGWEKIYPKDAYLNCDPRLIIPELNSIHRQLHND